MHITLASFVLLCLTACASPAPADDARLEATLVLIRTGPRSEPLTKEEQGQVFGGHFSNMERLAREGRLLVAGPYGRTRSDATLRGIFILDTADRQQAQALAESDPGFIAGVFRFDYHDLTTTAPLRECLRADLAALEAIERSGRKPTPGEGGRPYVILTAQGAGAAEALGEVPEVLVLARLDGEKTWAILDAKDAKGALELLSPYGSQLSTYSCDEWYGSGMIAKVCQPGSGQQAGAEHRR